MTTMHDVAREAGVSTFSVSAVVNGKTGQVSSETRRRILNAIAKTGYKPNHTARQLKTGTFNTIALISESSTFNALETLGFAKVLSGVNDAAAKAGLDLLFPTAMKNRNIVDIVDNLVSKGIDGALIYGPISLKKAALKAIDDCPSPIVCMDSYRGFSKAVTIDYDNIAGMRHAVSKLISHGHRKITYIGHPPVFQCFIDRMQAFCEVMQENDLIVDEKSIRIINESRVKSCVEDMISGPDRPTAIVVGETAQGISAWNTLNASGLRIPVDWKNTIRASVGGCSELESLAYYKMKPARTQICTGEYNQMRPGISPVLGTDVTVLPLSWLGGFGRCKSDFGQAAFASYEL